MPCAAKDNDQPPFLTFFVRDPVDLLHKRAGRIENPAPLVGQCAVNRARHAMRADQHPLPVRDLVQRVGGTHAAAFQPPDLVHIMNNLAVGPDCAVFLCLLFSQLDCAPHTEAEPGCLGYCYTHTCSFRA